MTGGVISIDDPRADDVRALLACGPFGDHLESSNSTFMTLELHGGSSVG